MLLSLFSHQVVSNSLQPHGLQHANPPFPSPSPGVCWSSCPLSQWCHPSISSSVALFYFCLQYFPASGSFPMSQLFSTGGQSMRASASASVLPKTLMLQRIEGKRRRWLDGITNSTDMSLANSGKQWRTGKPGMPQCVGLQRVRHDFATEQQ